jgi:hypothetical protein
VNVDSRKFVFTDIGWQNIDWKNKRNVGEKFRFVYDSLKCGFNQIFRGQDETLNKNINAELRSLNERGIKEQSKRLLEIAARQLAVNADENNRYEDASKFRYMAMETKRLDYVGWRRFVNLHWLYKGTSGYGESWSRAALVLVGIWFGFGLIYWLFGEFYSEISQNFYQSLGYSSLVMLLQKPEPRYASNLTFTLYILETILAPLQAALLALAIRRKFMR